MSTRAAMRAMLALAVPTFGQLIAEPLFILIDTAIMGHVGDAALAGLSIGSTVILTLAGLCVFLAYGTTSQVARLIGSGQRKRGLEAGIDGLWFAGLIGFAIAIVLFLSAREVAALMGARGMVLEDAAVYIRALAFGMPGMLLVYAANGIFRGLQKVRITLIAAVLGAVVNTALEVLMVIILPWGIFGSGFATCLAQWFMGLFLVSFAWVYSREESVESLESAGNTVSTLNAESAKNGLSAENTVSTARLTNRVSWRPRLHGVWRTASDGAPLFVRTLALRIAMVATVMLAASMGFQVLAAYQVVGSSWNFVINMLDAIGIAGQTLVATAIGARHREESLRLARLAGYAGLAGGVVLGVAMVLLGFVAPPLFSPNGAIQQLIMVGMVVLGLFLPLGGWMWALDGVLIGAGDFRYLAWTCSLTTAVYLPIMYALNRFDAMANPSDTWRMALLWLVINVLFVGGRALANGLRVRSGKWLQVAIK